MPSGTPFVPGGSVAGQTTAPLASLPSSHGQTESMYLPMGSQEPQASTLGFRFTGMTESPAAGFTSGSSMAESPGWLPLASLSPGIYQPHHLLSPAI